MKKILLIAVIAGSLIACNDTSDSTEEAKDALDSAAEVKKDNIDSTAEQRIDRIDSTTERKKDSLDRKDSANRRD
jgi:hypothetical protein